MTATLKYVTSDCASDALPPGHGRALAGYGEDMITHGAKDTTSACITNTACVEAMREAMCSHIVTELLRLILMLNKRLGERAAPEPDTV